MNTENISIERSIPTELITTNVDRELDPELIFKPPDLEKSAVISSELEAPETILDISKASINPKLHYFLAACAPVVFISISMTIGILIVYFKSPIIPSPTCSLTFRTLEPSLNYLDAHPRSIALGDFNNDSILDIVIANSNTDNIGIFFGYDNGTFATQITYSTGLNSGPYSVAVGDLNNDKKMDIVVANYEAHSVGVFFGYDDGNFTNQITYSTGASRPLQLVLSDLNNDSWIDIVVLNYCTSDIGIFVGSANTSFKFQTTYSTGYDSLPSYITIADINDDFRFDIIVANKGTDNIGIFFGYGDGTFASQKLYSTSFGSHPCSIAVSDLNNDNQLDIIVTKYGTHQIGIFHGYENGSFANEITFSTNDFLPFHVAIRDINMDNRKDIIVAYNLNNSIEVFLGHSDGTFSNEAIYSTGIESRPYSIIIDDLNKDYRFDLVVINGGTNNIGVYIGYNPVSFLKPKSYALDSSFQPVHVTVADFNNDNFTDIIVFNESNSIGVFFGYSNGSFDDEKFYSVEFDFSSQSYIIQDLNNDHQLDIVMYNINNESVCVFLRNTDGTFQNFVAYSTGFQYSFRSMIATVDVNNDNQSDLIVSNDRSFKIVVFLGYGNGTFLAVPIDSIYSVSFVYVFSLGDFNNDGKIDIAMGDYNSGICRLLGYGNGTFGNEKIYQSNSGLGLNSMVSVDLNNDSQLDIVVAYYNSYHVGIWLGHGDGTYANEILYFLQDKSFPTSVMVDDFNNDHYLDIFVGYFENGYTSVLLGYGNGTFASPTMYYTGMNYNYLAIGHFNNNNRLDVVVINEQIKYINVFFGYDSGAFINQTTYSTGSASHPVSIITGNFDSDNQQDIVVADSGTDSIRVYFGDRHGNFSSEKVHPVGVGALPSSIAKGDFDNDNQLDIVVTNAGNDSVAVFRGHRNGIFTIENMYSTGFESRPSSVTVGNFNHDAWLDIAVANYGSDSIGIFLGYKYSRFITQTIYSTGANSYPRSVAVGDFNNDQISDIIVSNIGSENIILFLGDGNEHFTLQAIYSTGKGSFPSSIAAGDFNHDNRSDVVVANQLTRNIMVFLGFDNGTLGNQTTYPIRFQSSPESVIVDDFNNDKNLDIAIAISKTGEIGIFLGYGNGSFASEARYSTEYKCQPTSLVTGDFNKDNLLDIVVIDSSYKKNMGIFFGDGDGNFTFQRTYSINDDSQPISVVIDDFNEDTCLDVVVADRMGPAIFIFLGNCNGTFANFTSYSTDDLPSLSEINVGDFNNDRHQDLVVAGGAGFGSVILIFGHGDGTFGRATTYPLGSNPSPSSIVVSDFNNDSYMDVAVSDQTTNGVIVFLGYCCDSFNKQTLISTGSGSKPHSIAIGDFNVDGNTDLVIPHEGTSTVGILLGYENGTFKDQITFQTGSKSRPVSVATGDFNSDNRLDITVANYDNETVSVLLGYGDGTFQYNKSYWIGSASRPCAVITGDFNNDTHLDIAVSNDGTNNVHILFGSGDGKFLNVETFTTGYNSQPCSLAVGDFNGDTQLDIAIAMPGMSNIGVISKLC